MGRFECAVKGRFAALNGFKSESVLSVLPKIINHKNPYNIELLTVCELSTISLLVTIQSKPDSDIPGAYGEYDEELGGL